MNDMYVATFRERDIPYFYGGSYYGLPVKLKRPKLFYKSSLVNSVNNHLNTTPDMFVVYKVRLNIVDDYVWENFSIVPQKADTSIWRYFE